MTKEKCCDHCTCGANKKDLLVSFVLDRSGSMNIVRDATIEGFNGYVSNLKDVDSVIRFTLVQFDTQGIDTMYNAVPLHKVTPLSRETYVPRAGTPLYDAVGRCIAETEERARGLDTDVICVIQTDGQENSSHEFTIDSLRKLIDKKRSEGWEFIFMGADQDAWNAEQWGINAVSTLSHDSTPLGVKQAFASVGKVTGSYAASRSSADVAFIDNDIRGITDDEDEDDRVTTSSN